MTNDGYRNFAYDDENELIGVWVSNVWSNSFSYDGKMRRRIVQQYTYLPSSSSYLLTNEVHFIYDGNLVVEERSAANVSMVSYTRGNDLSGTLQGAGGIGGLLARTTYGQELPGAPKTSFYHADGNGNVTALIYPDQQLAAKYLYDPFGNMLAMSGPLMNFNKYRFSSKDWDDNLGLYYYLYRFYDPNLQRWPNRDPLSEFGFQILRDLRIKQNLYAVDANAYDFVGNDPEDGDDLLGLSNVPVSPINPLPPWLKGPECSSWLKTVASDPGSQDAIEACRACCKEQHALLQPSRKGLCKSAIDLVKELDCLKDCENSKGSKGPVTGKKFY